MSVEVQAQSSAEFQQWAAGALADFAASVAGVETHLDDLQYGEVRAIAPTTTAPVFASAPQVEAPRLPIPVIPGPAAYHPAYADAERDAAGRRSERVQQAAAELGTTALEVDLARTAPRVNMSAAVDAYHGDRTGEIHPGFSDLGQTTGDLFDPNGKKGRFRISLWDEAGMWDPGK